MTINDIMLRDIMEADSKEREREEQVKARQARPGEPLVRWACIAIGVLAVATILFLAWCVFSDTPHRRGNFGGNESRQESECAPAK